MQGQGTKSLARSASPIFRTLVGEGSAGEAAASAGGARQHVVEDFGGEL